jgi:hypothetical protein
MNAEDLYRTLEKTPFQPMRIHIKDGRAYDVASREMVIVGVDFLDVGVPAMNQPEGVWATGVTIPLEQVVSIEALPGKPLNRS